MVVLPVPGDLQPVMGYAARVFAASDATLRADAHLAGQLGAQAIDGLEVQALGASISGYVRTMPQPGDTLRMAVDSSEPVETGLSFAPGDDPVA
jgi:hypothetical protein